MSQVQAIDLRLPKHERYALVLEQVKALQNPDAGPWANAGNILAALHFAFGFHWTGCYLVRGDQLVLGPFQGPVACTHIAFGRGVCGTAWQRKETVIVPDVDAFPGHIACSSLSKSEIVVPILNTRCEVIAVLDIDSDAYNTFDENDARGLETLTPFLAPYL
jgi:L-methionine (R)-S-oxide reductase